MSNRIQHTKKQLVAALEKSLGIVTTACKEVGISRWTFYNYYKEDEDFKKQVDEISEMSLDFTESKLLKLIKDENPAAILFYLKCKGKKRGYIERTEINMSNDKPIIFENVSKTHSSLLEDKSNA